VLAEVKNSISAVIRRSTDLSLPECFAFTAAAVADSDLLECQSEFIVCDLVLRFKLLCCNACLFKYQQQTSCAKAFLNDEVFISMRYRCKNNISRERSLTKFRRRQPASQIDRQNISDNNNSSVRRVFVEK